MALSNTATPYYYGLFREKVLRGEIPVCEEISQEMNRIDALIADPNMYFDDSAIDGYVKYCEAELTTTDGADLHLLDTFKLWAEQLWGWYYFTERTVFVSNPDGPGGHYERRRKKVRLTKKQYIIVARGGAKSMYAATWQAYWLNVDTSTTHQIVTKPTRFCRRSAPLLRALAARCSRCLPTARTRILPVTPPSVRSSRQPRWACRTS